MNTITERTLSTAAMALAIVLAGSCEDVNEIDVSGSVSVLGRIEAGADSQRLYVYRVAGVSEKLGFDPYQPNGTDAFAKYFVEDASVTIEDEFGRLYPFMVKSDTLAINWYDTSYVITKSYTTVNTVPVKANSAYTLRVVVAGRLVMGRTVTPGDFVLIEPTQSGTIDSTLPMTGFTVRWTMSAGGFGYRLVISRISWIDSPWGRQRYVAQVITETQDTFRTVLPQYVLQADSVRIEVTALDRNYEKHRHGGEDKAGLTNAFGYFGSGVRKSITLPVR